MTIEEAVELISDAVFPRTGTWADIGAGTGLFTRALIEILENGKVIAVDKSPHSLYASEFLSGLQSQIHQPNSQISNPKLQIEIVEADFHKELHLPPLDGILMANSLHYASDHILVLRNVLATLKPGGTFILIEYDTDKPNRPWVPNPISFKKFKELCEGVGLREPMLMGRKKSIYQDGEMYVSATQLSPRPEY